MFPGKQINKGEKTAGFFLLSWKFMVHFFPAVVLKF